MVASLSWCCLTAPLNAEGAEGKRFGPDAKTYQATVDRAVRFLAMQQAENGAVSAQVGIGPTALATLGLLQNGRTVADPQVAKGLGYLERSVQKDGGITGRVPSSPTTRPVSP